MKFAGLSPWPAMKRHFELGGQPRDEEKSTNCSLIRTWCMEGVDEEYGQALSLPASEFLIADVQGLKRDRGELNVVKTKIVSVGHGGFCPCVSLDSRGLTPNWTTHWSAEETALSLSKPISN